jgi:hypothetical protein
MYTSGIQGRIGLLKLFWKMSHSSPRVLWNPTSSIIHFKRYNIACTELSAIRTNVLNVSKNVRHTCGKMVHTERDTEHVNIKLL